MEHDREHIVARWQAAARRRYAADLTFAELRRGVQALSHRYVDRRHSVASGAVLDGAGKRAAFALFYALLHLHTTMRVVRSLGAIDPRRIVDLGCGTGAAAAGWALCCRRPPELLGLDRHPWAVTETVWTWRQLGLTGSARRGNAATAFPRVSAGDAVVAGWLVGELRPQERETFEGRLLDAARRGAAVLVLEPIARRGRRWWDSWSEHFLARGGRTDTWRFRWEPPDALHELDRAAGLDHAELTARSLSLSGDP